MTAGYPDDWPLEPGREFESEFFTEEELTAKQQENTWLRNMDAEDGVYTEYPTYDYSYSYYECRTIDELKKAFLYGNWAIRQCFTYRNLAFINQVNGGDEWWALKKFEDGRLLAFESVTFCAIINHETRRWVADRMATEAKALFAHDVDEECEMLTMKRHSQHPGYSYKMARYERGEPKDSGYGIYFIDKASDYFPEYIEQLLKATYQQCQHLEYTDIDFRRKWRE